MAGLNIPLHGAGGKGMGRPYAPAKRDEPVPVVVPEPSIGQLIDECLRKQKAFTDRHEPILPGFVLELRSLLDKIC